jgi:hypothetical protein
MIDPMTELIISLSSDRGIKSYLTGTIGSIAARHGLDAKTVAAVVYEESVSGTSLMNAIFSNRYEDRFFLKYIAKLTLTGYIPSQVPPTDDTERRNRATSWGLMQIMGATARENGFEERYLSELILPFFNIEIGCVILEKYLKKAGTIRKALEFYNGGADHHYVDRVIGHITTGAYRNVIND